MAGASAIPVALLTALLLTPPALTAQSAPSSEDDPLAAAESLGWVEGADTAPVTVVEFTDPSCPYCASFHAGTRQALIDEFVTSGQVRWITLTWVSGLYPNSDALTMAAECAGRQGRYDGFMGAAYSARDRWVVEDDATAMEEARRLASTLGLDLSDFDRCRSDRAVAERAQAVMELARANGVRGTPTWFVNGFLVMGDLPLGYARQFIVTQLQG